MLCLLCLEDMFRALLESGGGGGGSIDITRRYPDYSDDDASIEEDDNEDAYIPVAELGMKCNFIIDALPQSTVGDLPVIAKPMVSAAGYEKECCVVYSVCCQEYLDLSISRLGLLKLSIEHR